MKEVVIHETSMFGDDGPGILVVAQKYPPNGRASVTLRIRRRKDFSDVGRCIDLSPSDVDELVGALILVKENR